MIERCSIKDAGVTLIATPRIPSLAVLRAVEATVRHGSVSRAARELIVTDGAVSRAVREFEADLGFALFERRSRLIVATPTAQRLADELRIALDHLGGAVARARRSGSPTGPLVLSCEPTFLIRWLIPRLGCLQAAVGLDRELRLVSAGGTVPFAREGIDLAIRRADFPLSEDVKAEPFLDEWVGPVCRSDLVGSLAAPGAVEGVLLHTATRPDAWAAWSRLTDTPLKPLRELRFEHFYLSLQAAVAGAGFAIGPLALVADDVASKSLFAPRGFVQDGTEYVLLRQRDGIDPPTFRLVLEWLRGTSAEIAYLVRQDRSQPS
jgi:LysR family transcriptional regulator, glycine cleavage system transcriptional activator